MEPIELIQKRVQAALPSAEVVVVPNPSPAAQHSLHVPCPDALPIARFLRDDPALQFDYVSNVTGVDWPDSTHKEKVPVRRVVDGVEKEFLDEIEIKRPGRIEVVYHLYSMALKHGPLILRLQTENRTDQTHVPSLTPIWRACEFQEREVYDLFGVIFEGHPDLRRILMWEGFQDHPMRKDYVDPDDYEYEPTPHGAVHERARAHQPENSQP